MKEFVLKVFIVIFALVAIFIGSLANTARQHDIEQRAAIERALELTEGRVSQAHELFVEIRPYLDVLAGSEELHSREVFFVPGLLFAAGDDLLLWRSEWSEAPWLSSDKTHAVDTLLRKEIAGARDRIISFSETGMTATIFGIPLHAHNARAWIGFSYNETVAFPELREVRTEALGDNWYLSTMAIVHVNSFPPILITTLVFVLLTLAAIYVLFYWQKTGRSY